MNWRSTASNRGRTLIRLESPIELLIQRVDASGQRASECVDLLIEPAHLAEQVIPMSG